VSQSFPFILAFFIWDPSRIMFTIPFLGIPITWYGFFFTLGLFASFYAVKLLLKDQLKDSFTQLSPHDKDELIENLTVRIDFWILPSLLIGARLINVLFYDLSHYLDYPWEIFQIWKGGLSSHGALIGVLIGTYFVVKQEKKQFPSLNYLVLLDIFCAPFLLAGALIRVGNFFNQENVGTVTDVPWAVIFMHPIQLESVLPRHPVQLYEAFMYFIAFLLLLGIRHVTKNRVKPGFIVGCCLLMAFMMRIIAEMFKAHQPSWIPQIDALPIQMGQLLSVPFCLIGLGLMFYASRK